MFEVVLSQLAVVSVFVQKVVALVKFAYAGYKYQKFIDLSLSLVISSVFCVAWNIDVFAFAGIQIGYMIGNIFTGAFAALGSGVLNDVLRLLELWKEQKKAELTAWGTGLPGIRLCASRGEISARTVA